MQLQWLKLLIVVLAVSSSGANAAPPGTVKGRVLDSEGAVIKGARLLFHPDSSGRVGPESRADAMQESDALGRFEMRLEPGFYDMCVMASAFTPECKKILVVTGDTIQQNARLKADPLVIQHLGDAF